MGDYLRQGYTELINHPAQVVVTKHKLVCQYWNLSQHHALFGRCSKSGALFLCGSGIVAQPPRKGVLMLLEGQASVEG